MRRLAQRNPFNRVQGDTRRVARLATTTAASATEPQPEARGAVDAGSMDSNDVWQPNGRLDIDGLDGEMRLS